MIAPLGGSELAYKELTSRMQDRYKDSINIIISVCRHELIVPNKINILWQQLSYDQENVKNLADEQFVKKLDAIVFVSHWQYEKFKKTFNIPGHKCVVIQNATSTFQEHKKPKSNRLKLIYTSMPNRGLQPLIPVIHHLGRDDIDVDVYSSGIIYGTSYNEQNKRHFEAIFAQIREVKNIYLKGYASNAEIRQALMNSHIMFYPCIFEETSCMSAIEALSAGCKVVCNNLGALPETCSTWADMITFDFDETRNLKRYVKFLNKSIENYWSDETQDKLQDQVQYYKKYWSWDNRILTWEKLFNRLMEIKYGK